MKIASFRLIVIYVATVVGLIVNEVQAQESGLVVVGNSQSVPAELRMDELTSILMGEKQRWDNGKKIEIALMKTNTPIGNDTCARVFHMSGNDLNKHFLALVFQGKGEAPTFFTSARDLEEFVLNNEGAIGILDEASNQSTKIIIVDGKKNL